MSDEANQAVEPIVQRPKNLTEQVYTVIKQRIISGYYAQGDRLVERTLAGEFDVSKTPVREALARLERERLVISVPDRGIEVRTLTLEEVEYIMEIRKLLEGFSTRKATKGITEEDLGELRLVLEEGALAVERGDYEEYKDCDIRFHGIIRKKSGNTIAAEITHSLESQIRLLMTTTVHLPGRAEDSLACHSEILSAFERRDAAAAERAARKHIERVKKAILKHLVKENLIKQSAPAKQ